jgi:polar amino acid transport system substrate-binding protein
MKRIALLIFFMLIGVQGAAENEIVRIASGEYPPWTSQKLKYGGFTNHIIIEAFALEGYKVEVTFYPWKRAYETAKKGEKFQATSYWYPSEQRTEDFIYSDPLQEDAIVFFHLKTNPLTSWSTLADLKGKTIAAHEGFTYTDEFWAASKAGDLDVEVAISDELNFRKLLKGRVDLYPSDPLTGKRVLLEKFGLEAMKSVTYHPRPLTAVTGHLLFSKRADNIEKLVVVFNRGLATLRSSGRYALLQSEWMAGQYN